MTEEFHRWNPFEDEKIQDTGGHVFVDNIRDDGFELEILIRFGNDAPLAKLIFDDWVMYRVIDESFRLRTWSEAPGNMNGFWIVEGSSLIRFIVEESLYLESSELVHYAIFTDSACVDIVLRGAGPQVRR